ncbi:MAG: hypothetical protein JOZ44_14340 [Acidobacteria bacterium]|nr:hypothetical protein [Acidobacteriota bacterium]
MTKELEARLETCAYKQFEPRKVVCDGRIQSRGFQLRSYFVTVDAAESSPADALTRQDMAVSSPADQTRARAPGLPIAASFEEGVRLALDELPEERDEGCPGVGFIIKHHGATADYVVLAWWANENELPTRVFVTDPQTGRWRPANDESFCVWDLEIMWRERNHYIRTMLGGKSDVAQYLDETPT